VSESSCRPSGPTEVPLRSDPGGPCSRSFDAQVCERICLRECASATFTQAGYKIAIRVVVISATSRLSTDASDAQELNIGGDAIVKTAFNWAKSCNVTVVFRPPSSLTSTISTLTPSHSALSHWFYLQLLVYGQQRLQGARVTMGDGQQTNVE
jgi:hypothetical protein